MTSKVMARKSRIPVWMLAPVIALSVVILGFGSTEAASAAPTTVPGQSGSRVDADNNGYPDEGQTVKGDYTDTYSDADGDCVVRVNYRGTFDNDPYLDSGWIQNHYRCVAPDGSVTTYNYLIVHETDPRYTGNPEWSVWGNWEYAVLTEGGSGNLVRPVGHHG